MTDGRTIDISDHAARRYLERNGIIKEDEPITKLQLWSAKDSIIKEIPIRTWEAAKKLGIGRIKMRCGLVAVMKNRVVVTILPERSYGK